MTETELLGHLQNAASGNWEELRLSGRSIDALPPEIGQLSTLRELYLDNNDLTTIPTTIGSLTQLRVLDLGENQLVTLPREIGKLKALQKLKLGGNALTELPPEIGKLVRLELLELQGNRLTALPSEMGRLRKARRLQLSGNQLGSVPPEIGGMTGLRELDLSKNRIAVLPEQIGQLRNLATLNLDGNRLSRLPAGIGALESLTELLLEGNQLSSLPTEIGNLTCLEELQAQANSLVSLPKDICKLSNLRGLYLQKNSLTELPDALGNLEKLVELRVELNSLRSLPQSLGRLSGITRLDLQHNQLTSLPDSISGLSGLLDLRISHNRLISVPPALGQLHALSILHLHGNNLSALPDELGLLAQLNQLTLHRNRFAMLPAALGRMARLGELHLDGTATLPKELNELTHFREIHLYGDCNAALNSPFWNSVDVRTLCLHDLNGLGAECNRLRRVTQLDLSNNGLVGLPVELGSLSELRSLRLNDNRLSALPPELGRLESLESLGLTNNPLITPPPEITGQGTAAILAYLRELLADSQREWVSKLLVVGEGGVGKTSVLRALRREPFEATLSSTRGIDIRPLELRHPTLDAVTMMLTCWDFGGQEIYHATHQFFLTNRSLFLLVWNSRLGHEQGRLHYWLDMISARAPESPVLLVATHTDERDADLPFRELQLKYPQVCGSSEISNSSNEGVDALRDRIREVAASLPLMGERWPTAWLKAAQSVRARDENHMTPDQLWRLMGRHGVGDKRAAVLARWLHELGDLLFFQDDRELDDTVILKPQWVTKSIGKVLESERVIAAAGVFSREDMEVVWKMVPSHMRNHFLMLMEKFDLSYRIQESDDVSLVVERLPLASPSFESRWEAALNDEYAKELSISYSFATTMPAGIPTWFIARSHRFTTGTHWRNGALLADPEGKHLALVHAFRHDRQLTLSVRGPCPVNFFTLLSSGFAVFAVAE